MSVIYLQILCTEFLHYIHMSVRPKGAPPAKKNVFFRAFPELPNIPWCTQIFPTCAPGYLALDTTQ